MSPMSNNYVDITDCGPRASGDEPDDSVSISTPGAWSPRERG